MEISGYVDVSHCNLESPYGNSDYKGAIFSPGQLNCSHDSTDTLAKSSEHTTGTQDGETVILDKSSSAPEKTITTIHRLVDYPISPICPSGSSITNMPHSFNLQTPDRVYRASTNKYVDLQSPLSPSCTTISDNMFEKIPTSNLPVNSSHHTKSSVLANVSSSAGTSVKLESATGVGRTHSSEVRNCTELDTKLKIEDGTIHTDLHVNLECDGICLEPNQEDSSNQNCSLPATKSSSSDIIDQQINKEPIEVDLDSVLSDHKDCSKIPLVPAAREVSSCSLVDELLTVSKTRSSTQNTPVTVCYSNVKVEPK